jgi:hypothetical protein
MGVVMVSQSCRALMLGSPGSCKGAPLPLLLLVAVITGSRSQGVKLQKRLIVFRFTQVGANLRRKLQHHQASESQLFLNSQV